jgi:hypothetical protein
MLYVFIYTYIVKKFVTFPSSAGMSLIKLSLGGNNLIDIPTGTGMSLLANLFYSVLYSTSV